jgi:hypothetical protein
LGLLPLLGDHRTHVRAPSERDWGEGRLSLLPVNV